MGAKMLRVVRLFGISAKMDLAWLLRDTKFALFAIMADVLSNLSGVSGVFLIALRFGGIGSMSEQEVLFMMAYSTMVGGLVNLFGCGNNIHISRIIGRGQLDHLFIQPLSLKTQLVTCGFMPFTASSNFIIGVILTVIAILRLDRIVSIAWLLSLLAYLFTSFVIVVAWSYFVSCAAFYAPVAAEEISHTAIDGTWSLGTFPLGGMPLFVQLPMLTFLPQGLMAWFPAMCLLGKPPFSLAYYPMFFALLLSVLSYHLFKKGLDYYVRKGSNRYLPYGYR